MAEKQFPFLQLHQTVPIVAGQHYFQPSQLLPQADQILEPRILDFGDILAANGLQPRFEYVLNLDVSAASRAQFLEPHINYPSNQSQFNPENFVNSSVSTDNTHNDSSNAESKIGSDQKQDGSSVVNNTNETKSSSKTTTKISKKSDQNKGRKEHTVAVAVATAVSSNCKFDKKAVVSSGNEKMNAPSVPKKGSSFMKTSQPRNISYAQATQSNKNCKNTSK